MNKSAILSVRQRMMSTRKVVCTGNPNRPGTLASGFKKLFPDAVFLCRDTGWDLANLDAECRAKLQQMFSQCNTFLNCSYIAPGVQESLLDICNQSVKFCDVVNIGSTHEYDGLGNTTYKDSKLGLREKSLSLNSFRFRTCHMILGGIKTDASEQKANWLDIDLICHRVKELWEQPYLVPITSMDQHKEPW